MTQIRLFWGPDQDQAWSRNAGVCKYMTQLFPTARNSYASVSADQNYFGSSTLNSMPLIGYLFRQVAGTERLLLFNTTSIDEYDSSASRTSRATGYNGSTIGWSAAAFGNSIIACNYLDATQVSSGTSFGNLGGSPPKARHVTVQSNFVMLADTDDGTNQYADQVWWSGIGNTASWTPDLATQAGNIRLQGVSGPIRCLVNFRDYVVAFKDDATFVGQYVGPPFIWNWRMASNRIGCVGQHAAAELGGVLYFLHSSGIYSFDGSQFINIGRPVLQTIQYNAGVVTSRTDTPLIVDTNTTAGDLRMTQVVTDDVDGNVLFAPLSASGGGLAKRSVAYAYNVMSRQWGSAMLLSSSNQDTSTDGTAFVKCTNSDIRTFKTITATNPRFLFASTRANAITMSYLGYPGAAAPGFMNIQTGVLGSVDKSLRGTRMQMRFLLTGATPTAPTTMQITPYHVEAASQSDAGTVVSGAWNSTFQAIDFVNHSRFATVNLEWPAPGGANDIYEVVGADFVADQFQRP